MSAKSFYDMVSQRLSDNLADAKEQIANGNLDHEQYKFHSGRVKALRDANEALNELYEQYQKM